MEMTYIDQLEQVRGQLLRIEELAEDFDTSLAFRIGLLADEVYEEINEALDNGSFE